MQAETNSTSGSATRRSMWRSCEDPGTRRRCRQAAVKRALVVQPIRDLYEERVPRVGIEQPMEVTRSIAGAHRRLEVVTSLTPDQKQRRAGPVLPPHHQVRVEELGVEVARHDAGVRLQARAGGRR